MTQHDDSGRGTATPVATPDGEGTPAVLSGRVAKATHQILAEGLSESAVDAIRKQAERLIERVVSAYGVDVARGEVGHGGSAAASSEPPFHLQRIADGEEIEPRVPGATGLLYGRIQSGKTAGMISLVSYALDNGFRTIIVLTSDNVALVDQTADRFMAVHGVRVVSSTTADRWSDDVPNMKRYLPSRGLVAICSKNVNRLERLRDLLEAIGAPTHPTLILDDEADQASLDANTRKRKTSSTPSLVDPTRVSEEIQKIRATAPHNMFLQVTATPFAMFLQNVESPFRPSFTFLLEPGMGYTGGERFFSEDILDLETDQPASPPLYLIPDDEPKQLRENPDQLPVGLMRAMVFFLVAASARAVIRPSAYSEGQNFLCHESHRVADHKAVADLVRPFLDKFAEGILSGETGAQALLEWAYAELQRTVDLLPDIEEIREDIDLHLPNREVIVVNTEGDSLRPRPRVPNFIIGGNIVGRGLTIPNLLVTYYGRNPQVSQMDTMLQHARMFGYREPLMPFTRVFLAPSLAARFQGIHIAERELRQSLRENESGEHVPVKVIGKLRPTRHGVLDPGQVTTIRSGQHLYPMEPDLHMSREREKLVIEVLKRAGMTDEIDRSRYETSFELDDFQSLLRAFQVGEWSETAIMEIASSLCGTERKPWLVVRGMSRRSSIPLLPTGAIGGNERSEARRRFVPTFFVFRQLKKLPVFAERQFLYPSIVFPDAMPNHVFNALDES